MTDSSNFVLKRIGTYDLTGNRLGKGNFAYVELATNRITKTKVAMKVIDTRKIKDEYMKRNILREALLLKKVNHPNIVRLYETLKQHSIYCIVTEYVPGGELLSHLRRQNDSKLSESQARPIMRQLISALYHMHQNGIVHRDLKMENILLDESKKNIKIVDFGLSNICQGDNLLKTQCGSPEYAAPELFRRGCRYGTEVDLWSLGVIMYGIVVGRLPFRSPHYGSRGRSDLVDQTSRGLSCAHNKYLILLTPHCRDLLRKLLEPNPQMRLPLLEVMDHPWITVEGTAPLAPYNEPLCDEQLCDKVLGKTSQLIKIDKPKIAFHIQRKRYDAISGVYNLLLDEELKSLSRSNDDSNRLQATSEEESSFIQVSIISSSSVRTENGAQGPESESAASTDSQNSPTEQDWEQAPTRQHIVPKLNERKDFEQPLDGLRIRGLRICSSGARSDKGIPHARTRPNTANAQKAPEKSPPSPKRNAGASRAWQRAGKSRCKSCFPRFASRFDTGLQGRRVIMSSRARQDPELLASQWEAKLNALASEGGEDSVGHSEQGVNTSSAGDNCKKSAIVDVHVRIAKSVASIDQEPNVANWKPLERVNTGNCTSSGTPEMKQTTESNKTEGNKTAQTLQENQKSLSCRGSARSQKTGAKLSPSSLAAQNVHRVVSPLKTSQFVDLADYDKYVPQPPKSRFATLGGAARLAVKDGNTEEEVDSFSAAYQSFAKTKKPQHIRLSVKQAQEILQHESKFHAKYGRRLSTEAGASNTSNADIDKQTQNQASRFSHASTGTSPNKVQQRAAVQQLSKPGYIKGVSFKRYQGKTIVCDVKREENIEKQEDSSHDQIFERYPSTARSSHDDNSIDPVLDTVESGQSDRSCINGESRVIEARLKPKHEESLKRQKEKEQTEDYERERLKFLRELEDQERQKIITEYLQEVYSHSGQTPSPQNGNKVSRQGRIYPSVPRPQEEPNGEIHLMITRPAPILHQTARVSQRDKKISFRGKQGVTGTNGVRFFTEWNKSLFTDYINSSDGDAETGKEKLQNQSYPIEQHLEGVLDETSVRRGLHLHQQLIQRET